MTEQGTGAVPQSEQKFELKRVFNAPRDMVWKAWTEVDRLKQWWGPKGLTMQSTTLDLRPGGLFHYSMSTPDGGTMWGKWAFLEITPQDRLVYLNSFSDEAANTLPPPFPDPWPAEIHCTIVFAEQGDKTEITLTGLPYNATEEQIRTFIAGHGSMEQGFGGTLSQLDEYLAGQ